MISLAVFGEGFRLYQDPRAVLKCCKVVKGHVLSASKETSGVKVGFYRTFLGFLGLPLTDTNASTFL
jgi:hypothetical protein